MTDSAGIPSHWPSLTAQPIFAWEKAVTFAILARDSHGVERSLDQRGSGIRRLLMVAFFQYLAQKQHERDVIYAVEEPENCLHPGLQRELADSFADLAADGAQVVLTSHSPVFAGASPAARPRTNRAARWRRSRDAAARPCPHRRGVGHRTSRPNHRLSRLRLRRGHL